MDRTIYRILVLLFLFGILYVFFVLKPFSGGAVEASSGSSDVKVADDLEKNTVDGNKSNRTNKGDDYKMKNPNLQEAEKLPALTADEVLTIGDDDIVFGNPKSEILIFDYSSVTCVHCAYYLENIFPKLKKDLIDTNKIGYIKRLIPSNGPALKTSMVLSCIEDKQKRYGVIATLLKYQHEWIDGRFDEYLKKLEEYTKIAGLSTEAFNKCLEDDSLGVDIYNHLVRDAKAIQLSHSPAIYVNGAVYAGTYEYEDIKRFIESYMQ